MVCGTVDSCKLKKKLGKIKILKKNPRGVINSKQ